MRVRAIDGHVHELSRFSALEAHHAVDFRRVRARAPHAGRVDEDAQLDRVGCFAYSPVDGAAANGLPDAVPAETKESRRKRFMEVQAAISARKLQRKVGKTLKVLVDEPGVGRSSADAPEIDGVVRFKGPHLAIRPGEFRDVTIDRADEHDLYGRLA